MIPTGRSRSRAVRGCRGRWAGGRDIHVPKARNVGPGHRLALVMGLEAAQSFAGRFCGESVYVPKARKALVKALAWRCRSCC